MDDCMPIEAATRTDPGTEASLFIGVMSGTSLDGIDAVLTSIGRGNSLPKLLASHSAAFDPVLRQRLLKLASGEKTTLQALGETDIELARAYAAVVNELLSRSGIGSARVSAVGCHGQTVHHAPGGTTPFTLQLGDPNTIAVLTGVAVVADFRRRDMALGGQGAPLAPAFHDRAFRHPDRTRVVLNLGGIANISVLVPGSACWGADTGPANILMDAWIAQVLGQAFDAGGEWAAGGKVCHPLLATMLDDEYFAAPAPKSTGRERFNLAWLDSHLSAFSSLSPRDVQATLLALTVASVVAALPPGEGDLIVCGGGALNRQLLRALADAAPSWKLSTTETFGFDPRLVEAVAFAYFASRTCAGLTANLPAVTGARRECILGTVFQP